MKQRDNKAFQEWMDERIEAYLDGALPAEEQEVFENVLASDPVWREEVQLASRISAGLHALPEPQCPPYVTRAILARTRRNARQSYAARILQKVREAGAAAWRPALSMMVLLTVVVGSVILDRSRSVQYATPEVKQAAEDVRWALAFVSDVSRQAGISIREEVFRERVIAPIQSAVGSVIDERQIDDSQR